MYVKLKSYYLKKDIDPEILTNYGFRKTGDNYTKDITEFIDIRFYHDTRRIVFVDYPYKNASYRKVRKYIQDLINSYLVEIKTNYEWWVLIGRYQNYSERKRNRIEAKLNELNGGNYAR